MIQVTASDITKCITTIAKSLAPFFVEPKNASQIFVLSDKGDSIELHENTIDSSIAIEASHEEAKNFFIHQLTLLYGKAVIDALYPQETRKEPLTVAQANFLKKELNAFQNSVIAACQRDPSKYESSLQAHLKTLQELQKGVIRTFESNGKLEREATSFTNSISKQLGISVQTCVLAGLAVTSVAGVTSGGTLCCTSCGGYDCHNRSFS